MSAQKNGMVYQLITMEIFTLCAGDYQQLKMLKRVKGAVKKAHNSLNKI